jgi:hypothetical protein
LVREGPLQVAQLGWQELQTLFAKSTNFPSGQVFPQLFPFKTPNLQDVQFEVVPEHLSQLEAHGSHLLFEVLGI